MPLIYTHMNIFWKHIGTKSNACNLLWCVRCQRNSEPRCGHRQGSKNVQTRFSLFLLGWIWGRAGMVQSQWRGRVQEVGAVQEAESWAGLTEQTGEQVQSDSGRRAEQAKSLKQRRSELRNSEQRTKSTDWMRSILTQQWLRSGSVEVAGLSIWRQADCRIVCSWWLPLCSVSGTPEALTHSHEERERDWKWQLTPGCRSGWGRCNMMIRIVNESLYV